MANDEHLQILKQGIPKWNKWITEHKDERPDFTGAELTARSFDHAILWRANFQGADLRSANFYKANLMGANFSDANLINAYLGDAHLEQAIFIRCRLHNATLIRANLNNAYLIETMCYSANMQYAQLVGANLKAAVLHDTNLTGANLKYAKLHGANFLNAYLSGANLTEARAYRTVFADVDLSKVEGIESVKHDGPSEISISTIYLSAGQIPENFLRGCGVPDAFVTQIPALVVAAEPVQFHSCFISYTSQDEELACRLHERLRAAGLRVWFAPEDIKGGEKLYEQIDLAIQVHDRLLLVLSEKSMRSEWVMTELRRARKAEVKEDRRKLFPIRLVDYEALRDWECFDTDLGIDLAVEVRKYFIPDFTNWKDHDHFEAAFKRLHADLKASA